MINIIGLILSLSLIIFLAYKGYSTIITAPLIALLTVLIIGGDSNKHLMLTYTEIYMSGFSSFVKNYFPIFLTGAIFARLMEESLYVRSIANFITNNLGKDKTIISVVLAGALLTYGGVSLFTVAFVLYPIANTLFKEANIPKRLIPGTIALGAFTFTMTALPGTPEIQNVIPMRYFGTDTFSAPILGLSASLLMLISGIIWLTYRVKQAEKSNEGYGDYNIDNSDIESNNLPNIYLSITPILIIFISNLFFSKIFYKIIDGSYLDKYNLTLDNVSGKWSVIISIVISILFILIINKKGAIYIQKAPIFTVLKY